MVLHLLRAINTTGNNLACNQTKKVFSSLPCEQPSPGSAMGYRAHANYNRARKCLDVPLNTIRRQSSVQFYLLNLSGPELC